MIVIQDLNIVFKSYGQYLIDMHPKVVHKELRLCGSLIKLYFPGILIVIITISQNITTISTRQDSSPHDQMTS